MYHVFPHCYEQPSRVDVSGIRVPHSHTPTRMHTGVLLFVRVTQTVQLYSSTLYWHKYTLLVLPLLAATRCKAFWEIPFFSLH